MISTGYWKYFDMKMNSKIIGFDKGNIICEVKISKIFIVRLRLAVMLIKLASFISGGFIEVHVENETDLSKGQK